MVNLSLILSRVVLMLYLLTLKNFVKYEYLLECEYSYIKYLRHFLSWDTANFEHGN